MQTVVQAIARMEGYYMAGSRASRNANPGNLDYEPWLQKQFDAVPEIIPHGYAETPRFACFPDDTTGFQALRFLLSKPQYAGKTVSQVLDIYAPPVENQTNAYIENVCAWCGITPETVLTPELIG